MQIVYYVFRHGDGWALRPITDPYDIVEFRPSECVWLVPGT